MLQWRSFSARWGRGRGVSAAIEATTEVALYQLPKEIRSRNGGASVVTPEECWAHVLQLPVQAVTARLDERFRVKLALRVLKGQIGAGVLRNGSAGFYDYAATSGSSGASWQVLELVTPRLAECGPLIINNASSEGASRAELRIVEIAEAPLPSVPASIGSIRTVHVIEDVLSGNLQELYLDNTVQWLRPNLTFVHRDGSVSFETNEIGLKGDPSDPARRQSVIWGDSVTFGIGRGWPCLLDELVPGYQFLNGGIEGDDYSSVLRRALALNREREIALNLILLGWHTLGRNQHVRSDLSHALGSIANPVLVTMPTALNPAIVNKDLSACFGPGHSDEFAPELGKIAFYFYGSAEYSVAFQQKVYLHITERNDIVREVAAERGLPLIDLFTALNTEATEDFREDFFDVMHPRPRAYPRIARAVYDGLRPVLGLG